MTSLLRQMSQSELRGRTIIQKIRDSDAGGSQQSMKQEEYFHGFIPTAQTSRLLRKKGDFLVRQAVKAETKNNGREQFVISIRLLPSTFVRKEHEEWFHDWDKAGKTAHDQGRLIDESVYEKFDEKEKDHYLMVEEGIGHFYMKYSRRSRLFYMNKFGFTHSSGLFDYHQRHKISVSPDIREAVMKKFVQKEKWQFNHEQIERERKLGSGAFGEVFLGTLRLGLIKTEQVAVKTINMTVTAEENEQLFSEAMLMQRLENKHIVKFLGVASNVDPVMVIMKFCQNGSGIYFDLLPSLCVVSLSEALIEDKEGNFVHKLVFNKSRQEKQVRQLYFRQLGSFLLGQRDKGRMETRALCDRAK